MSPSDAPAERNWLTLFIFAVAAGAFGIVAGVVVAELANRAARDSAAARIVSLEQELTAAKDELAPLHAQLIERQQQVRRLQENQTRVAAKTAQIAKSKQIAIPNSRIAKPAEDSETKTKEPRQSATPELNLSTTSSARRRQPFNSGRGEVTGGNFSYDNLSARAGNFGLELMGDMRNDSGSDWTTTIFQVSAYDTSDRLVGVSGFFVNNFGANATTSFTADFLDFHGDGSNLRFRLHFQGGVEQ